MTVEFKGMAQQGWQCPVCKAVYAPWVAVCFNCKQSVKYAVTTTPSMVRENPPDSAFRMLK